MALIGATLTKITSVSKQWKAINIKSSQNFSHHDLHTRSSQSRANKIDSEVTPDIHENNNIIIQHWHTLLHYIILWCWSTSTFWQSHTEQNRALMYTEEIEIVKLTMYNFRYLICMFFLVTFLCMLNSFVLPHFKLAHSCEQWDKKIVTIFYPSKFSTSSIFLYHCVEENFNL